jgi:OFA family oxalate/formate antiporter-like MFS transporter
LGISRASLSLVFSVALGVFSSVMFFGTGVHARMPTHNVAAFAMALAGTGILVAGSVPTFPALMLGFGGIFGASIGIGYGIAVGTANMAVTNKGLITGLIVAAFATTPVFLAPILRSSVLAVGPHATFQTVGKVILAMAPVVWACFKFGKVQIPLPAKPVEGEAPVPFSTLATIFAAFGAGCLGGLMTIAHATGIISAFGGSAVQAAMAVQYGALGNYFGRILAGVGCDKFGPKVVLGLAASAAAASLLACNTLFAGNPVAAIFTVILCGIGYGCSMTSYAVLTRRMVGGAQFGQAFGKVFIGF